VHELLGHRGHRGRVAEDLHLGLGEHRAHGLGGGDAHVALGGDAWGARGFATVIGWTIVLTAAAAWAYRRDTGRT